MELKDREVKVLAPELLQSIGVDDGARGAFVEMERVGKSTEGFEIKELTHLIREANHEFKRTTMLAFEVGREENIQSFMSFYSQAERIRLQGLGGDIEMGKQDPFRLTAMLGDMAKSTERDGRLEIRFKHMIKFKASDLVVGYGGLIGRNGTGFEYVEQERSLSVSSKGGDGTTATVYDVLTVKFK